MKTILCITTLSLAATGQYVSIPPVPPIPPMPEIEVNIPPVPPIPPIPPVFAYSKWPGGFAFQIKPGRDAADNDRIDRAYERGTRALDKRQWDEAVNRFDEVNSYGKHRTDGALYWKAYALSRLGRSSEATAALDSLAKTHPQSRWLNDAKALRVEIAQAAGKPVSPENTPDDDMKLMAINSLMNTDPERSIPLLEKLLQGSSSPKLRERALFVLSQSDSPKAREAVARIAKGGANPDLQMKAVQSLGVYGSKESRQLLAEIYAQSNDISLKKNILHSFMVSGERDRLLTIAKSDSNVELRGQAIHWLGTMGASSQLADLYAGESSTELKSKILHSLFITGNAKALVDIARKETNPELKKAAVQNLTHMRSKDATDFMLELLNK